jgi:hypothetical protein
MAKISLEVGGLSFPSKTTATVQTDRDRYQMGERIPDPDATELSWLLERHPDFRDKVGCGIAYFSVRLAEFDTRCFEIVRKDGSSTDFSFGTCIDGKAASPLSEAVAALRAAVTGDILQKKREWFRERGDADDKVRPLAGLAALRQLLTRYGDRRHQQCDHNDRGVWKSGRLLPHGSNSAAVHYRRRNQNAAASHLSPSAGRGL